MGNPLNNNDVIQSVLSISEIKIGFDAFTKAKWIKLEKTANILCTSLPFEGKDLLHTVICKALEGKRKCRRDLPIEVFIYGAMESLVDAYIKKQRHDPLKQRKEVVDDENSLDINEVIHHIDTPEEELAANQTLEKIKLLFTSDERAMTVLSYQMDGLSPQEIQKLMVLTSVQYASILKSIRRKYEKLQERK